MTVPALLLSALSNSSASTSFTLQSIGSRAWTGVGPRILISIPFRLVVGPETPHDRSAESPISSHKRGRSDFITNLVMSDSNWVYNGSTELDQESKYKQILAVSIVLTAVMSIVVVLRGYVRGVMLKTLGWDDFVIFFAAVSSPPLGGSLNGTEQLLSSYVPLPTLVSAMVVCTLGQRCVARADSLSKKQDGVWGSQ